MKLHGFKSEVVPAYLYALYPQGCPDSLRIIRYSSSVEFAEYFENIQPGDCTHFIFEPSGSIWAGLTRFLHIIRLKKALENRHFDCDLVGISGSLAKPELLVTLQRNVLWYANTVTFRFADSPLRAYLKKLFSLFPGGLLWNGPVILVVMSVEATFSGHLTLLSPDRQVSFLFNPAEKWPVGVRKTGDRDDLKKEYKRHLQAIQLLDRKVPSLLDELTEEKQAFFTLEYIPEFTLVNRVAEAWWGRRKAFVHESSAHLDFCCEVYRQFMQAAPPQHVTVTATEVNELLEGISVLLKKSPDSDLLKSVLHKTVGMILPKMIQHGDFCVRNVLIPAGVRGRVLIDWEDLQESRWALADFVLLCLSLREVYVKLFGDDSTPLESSPDMNQRFLQAEETLKKLLDINSQQMAAAELLSLVSLCRQNLVKDRQVTAAGIFDELIVCLHQQSELWFSS